MMPEDSPLAQNQCSSFAMMAQFLNGFAALSRKPIGTRGILRIFLLFSP
jgi:hypothetical protein